MAVRNAIGDREAKAIARKQGVVGKLTMLKTLVSECTESLCRATTNQTIFFFDDVWKSKFDDISTQSGANLPTKMSVQLAKAVQEMPFWKDRVKTQITNDNTDNDNGELDNGSYQDDEEKERGLDSFPASNPSILLESRRTALTRSSANPPFTCGRLYIYIHVCLYLF